MDGFGELPGLPGAATEFPQDAPGFELGVGALLGLRSLAWARLAAFCDSGLLFPLYGADVVRGDAVTGINVPSITT